MLKGSFGDHRIVKPSLKRLTLKCNDEGACFFLTPDCDKAARAAASRAYRRAYRRLRRKVRCLLRFLLPGRVARRAPTGRLTRDDSLFFFVELHRVLDERHGFVAPSILRPVSVEKGHVVPSTMHVVTAMVTTVVGSIRPALSKRRVLRANRTEIKIYEKVNLRIRNRAYKDVTMKENPKKKFETPKKVENGKRDGPNAAPASASAPKSKSLLSQQKGNMYQNIYFSYGGSDIEYLIRLNAPRPRMIDARKLTMCTAVLCPERRRGRRRRPRAYKFVQNFQHANVYGVKADVRASVIRVYVKKRKKLATALGVCFK
ncbi:hypothetical protein EVAR_31192_1 [Eumeta japonica]|uniref:Uncharacterized protein n=1 Tax=Eumeta variegata TaxID=151549 RepID=A0A4C1VVW2_EUMVA|nr:hypothetical protein EVAR_31192_1 [Eumeta japonica]